MKLKTFVLPSPFAGQAYSSRCGWGNGYVVIPKGHPLHGLGYDEIHNRYDAIAVHGGLTYANSGKHLLGEPDFINESDWIIGFDTAHYGDTPERWPSEQSVLNEANELAKQIENL